MIRARRVSAVLALAIAAGCAGLTACGDAEDQAAPAPTSSDTGPYPLAEIAPLDPAQVAPGPFEDDPAVQVFRATEVVLVWANLIDSSHFAQFTQYVDPASEPGVIDLSRTAARNEWVKIGPAPEVIVSVTKVDDGSVTVRSCGYTTDKVSKVTGEPRESTAPSSILLDTTLSPLTEAEVAELTAQGLEVPPLRVRKYRPLLNMECDASTATVQHFVDWQDYAPIGHYRLDDPWGVTTLDEDGNEVTVDRTDMP
jgi:hypothetical protein